MTTEDAIRDVVNVAVANGEGVSSITASLLWVAAEFMCRNEGKTKAKLGLIAIIDTIDGGAFDAVAAHDALNQRN